MLQIAAIREGMAGIVPVPLLTLMTGSHLEQLVCGLPDISIYILKQIVRYLISQEKFIETFCTRACVLTCLLKM